MDYLYPLNAIHRDGHVELLYTIDDVHTFIKKYGRFYEKHKYWYRRYIGYQYINDRMYPLHEHVEGYHPWIVRDDRGCVVKYEDVSFRDYSPYYAKYNAKIRKIAAQGLPIPRTGKRKWHRHDACAMKNSGSGHRNRNRSKAIYEAEEYGVKNNVGSRIIPWEDY